MISTDGLFGIVDGLFLGIGLSIFIFNRLIGHLTRRWHALLRRAMRSKRHLIGVGSYRVNANSVAVTVTLNAEYILRFYAEATTPITLRVINRDGDELTPEDAEAPAGAPLH